MQSFLSFMNQLQFPLSPFAKNPEGISKVKKVSTSKNHESMHVLQHLSSDNFAFIDSSNPTPSVISRAGVVLSGGQASGGHNVIWGLYDGLKKLNAAFELLGFLGGPQGILDSSYKVIDELFLSSYRNTGGFDMIGSGRTKIETNDQLEKCLQTVKNLKLDALVIIGGDDSNTNAAVIADYFLKHNLKCQVIGVPKTVDGDLKNECVEVSFGFDTASKLYSELTSNIMRDCMSAKKYYHFIKIMGRSASHLALETFLNTQANMLCVLEDVKEQKKTLLDVCSEIKKMIIERAHHQKNYGVILIPEGLIEAFSDVSALIAELNKMHKDGSSLDASSLSKQAIDLLNHFPEDVKKQLLYELDPHGNVQVSLIETEKLMAHIVQSLLKKDQFKGKFQAVCHFFGYEGRSCYPSYFDAVYAYHLGVGAAICLKENLTGYMVGIKHLDKHPDYWKLYALSIVSFMHFEERKGVMKPVIKKAVVDFAGYRYQTYMAIKETLKLQDDYKFLGPQQYGRDFEEIFHPPLILKD
jgi:diphosphate-dependent phosphofructokinase